MHTLHKISSRILLALVVLFGFMGALFAANNSGVISALFDSSNKLIGTNIQTSGVTNDKFVGNSITTAKFGNQSVTSTKVNTAQVQITPGNACLDGINEIRADGSLICAIPTGAVAPPTCGEILSSPAYQRKIPPGYDCYCCTGPTPVCTSHSSPLPC